MHEPELTVQLFNVEAADSETVSYRLPLQPALLPLAFLLGHPYAELTRPQILDVKKKIQESQTFPVENQKLIYSGELPHCLFDAIQPGRGSVSKADAPRQDPRRHGHRRLAQHQGEGLLGGDGVQGELPPACLSRLEMIRLPSADHRTPSLS